MTLMQTDAPRPRPDIVALLGSRICHDLISPLGAIGNGVELLAMSGTGPEIALISESVSNASARIRFFRIAFGAAESSQRIGRPEVTSILADLTRGSRLSIEWQAQGDQARPDVKLALLALQCLESAMPWGGRITVTETSRNWQVRGTAERLRVEEPLWQSLTDRSAAPEVGPAQVHFAILPEEAAAQGRRLAVETGAALCIAF
ncbi:histidine phosphotransferase family protein [Ostreiculturibacter nitratireducens]|uniref:histidine phosphotransferase family protein n=1 Tax=Ostreiculturibacter nitratireducens TaxID=3075226 RepID=UPI0031B6224B